MGQRDDQPKAKEKRSAGRPPALKPEHVQLLCELAMADKGMTLEALAQQLQQRCGVEVCTMTIRRALAAAGIRRVKPTRRAVPQERGKPARYGYTEAHRREAEAAPYSCALTPAEWELVADLFEREPHTRGAPSKFERKALVDACCYVLRTGCAWRLLPRDFPPWTTVYKAFVRWADMGLFESMHDRLREQWRQRLGRHHGPTAAVLDSQSNRSSPQGGEAGFDAGKKVKGRKRHIVVDTLGVVLAVTVTAASVQDRDGAPAVTAQACDNHPTLQKLWVDGAYAGQCAQQLRATHGLDVEVVRHPGNGNAYVFHSNGAAPAEPSAVPKGFVVLPIRWIVERTHAWNERWRRLVMHHDRRADISRAWVWLADACRLASRLTRPI